MGCEAGCHVTVQPSVYTWAMASTLTEIGAMIVRDPAVHGGRPIIAGAGVSVRAIAIDSNRGLTPEEIAGDRPHLSLAQVFAALACYHANKAEIDDDIEAEVRAYEEGAESSRRSQ
jgi:uncharacterized protein (DUF433 family)